MSGLFRADIFHLAFEFDPTVMSSNGKMILDFQITVPMIFILTNVF